MLKVDYTNEARGARLITTEPYAEGQPVLKIAQYTVHDWPTSRSIQVGPDTHLDDLGVLAYLNHACRPSVIVDAAALSVRAARPIAAGEELTFFYPSTEWDMKQPFQCLCGAPECIGEVAGAKHLPREVLARYYINDFIQRLLAAQASQ